MIQTVNEIISQGKITFNYEQDIVLWVDLKLSDKSNTNKKSETKPDPEGSAEGESVDQLKEELGKATKKIEKMEEKIDDQEKTTESIKHYKSESTTLVLSIVIGLMGIMGVGHIYLGRIRRGVIILIIGLSSWIAIFIPIGILGLLGNLEESSDDPTAIIAIFGGFAVVGIGVFVLFIWQILNSRKLCKEYNEYFDKHGKSPW